MHVGIVGINHKLADLKLRELLAKACQSRFGAGCSLHGDHSFVLLSTCNRTEIYFCSEDLTDTHTYILNILRSEVDEEFDQKLYSYFGADCFFHLCYVTAGLDSAIVAETEIQGQVKVAYQSTTEYATLPEDLHYLFQKSLQIGKRVRSELPLGRGMPDLEDAVFNIGLKHFENPAEARILFIGASDINQKILAFLKNKGMRHLTVCNRSQKCGEELAAQYQIPLLKWHEFEAWQSYDWIICGTKSPEYLITKERVSQQSSSKLIIDLCVPRNIDPQVSQLSNVSLFNIDQINHTLQVRKRKMAHFISQAEALIGEATRNGISSFREKECQRQKFLAQPLVWEMNMSGLSSIPAKKR